MVTYEALQAWDSQQSPDDAEQGEQSSARPFPSWVRRWGITSCSYTPSFRLHPLHSTTIQHIYVHPIPLVDAAVWLQLRRTPVIHTDLGELAGRVEKAIPTFKVIPPISFSTIYAQLAVGIYKGFEHTRLLSPNCDSLDRMLAGLETNGRRALALASVSATTATILQALGTGAHVLGINNGLETTFVDLNSATDEEVLTSIRPNTKLIWIETLTNPTLRLPPITYITSLIHSLPAASRPLIAIDSTILSPFYDSPLAASISGELAVHSITIHQRPLRRPLGRYHPPQRLHHRSTWNTNGARQSWRDSSFVTHPLVKEIIYAGFAEHPSYNNPAKILAPHAEVQQWEGIERKGKGDFTFGGMVSFRIGRAGELVDDGAVERFLTRTRFFTLAESLGGVESLAELPEKMTHGSFPPAEPSVSKMPTTCLRTWSRRCRGPSMGGKTPTLCRKNRNGLFSLGQAWAGRQMGVESVSLERLKASG
ncbi:hypothetical protein M422DRAFT_273647 [Sphaerobolus stellatus SS14]|uniref:cystathionine gamma-lyase n=1 Tax=Sphaerobolus stellatus (strain SS14) TaxID=990650 RepID=A0A0C9UJ67_SPHS4|nr:hypothetical protein M422DRAFT_273647 [Sphaerobolus stellatus SS14]